MSTAIVRQLQFHTERISKFICFVFALSLNFILVSSVAPNLSPDNINSCIGQMVSATCVAAQGSAIRWAINFVDLSISDVQKAFLGSDQPGETVNITNNRNHIFIFTLKSRLPTVSTLTTNMVHDLEGASVSCEDLSTAEVDTSLIHVISDTFTNISASSSLVYKEPMENSILIGIEWHQNPDIPDSPTLGNYTTLINPPIEMGDDFNTVNTSIELVVLYNQEYNISVFTNNCAGKRNLVLTILFSIGHCSYPQINPSMSIEGYDNGLENSQIRYYCKSGYVPSETMVANCTSSGVWTPNPAELVCQAQCTTPVPSRYMEVDLPTCNYSSKTTEGSVILFRCIEGFTPNSTFISICTREGKWDPDPLMHHCKPLDSQDNLQFISGPVSITSAVLIGVVCSLVMLIVGFVFGIVIKTMIERRVKHIECGTATPNPTVPASTSTLYENVKISETNPQSDLFDVDVNQAYEPITVLTST